MSTLNQEYKRYFLGAVGSPVCSSHKIPGYFQVKKVILQVTVWTILNSQEHKMWKKLSQYNIEILYILTLHVLSRFSAIFLVLSRFSHFLEQIPGYFWTWTDKIQISRFPGSAGGPGAGPMEKNIDSVHFHHFKPFLKIIFMAYYPFEKCWYVHFLRGKWGSEKVYVMYSFKCWQFWMVTKKINILQLYMLCCFAIHNMWLI